MTEISCYEQCNNNYTSMQPERLFCKKGCDSQTTNIESCKIETCNKLCIKKDQEGRLFKLFVRAPADPTNCLTSCILGCNLRKEDN